MLRCLRSLAVLTAGAAAMICNQNIIFLLDNQAVISSITDSTAHPAQGASIIFCRHVADLLRALNPFDVELIWVPGHQGIHWHGGNERADSIAKVAVNHRPIFESTISWAREKAKSRALRAWRSEWSAHPHTNLAATVPLPYVRCHPPISLVSIARNLSVNLMPLPRTPLAVLRTMDDSLAIVFFRLNQTPPTIVI